jgi:hypothetical protein
MAPPEQKGILNRFRKHITRLFGRKPSGASIGSWEIGDLHAKRILVEGDPGTGKTSLAMLPLLEQYVRENSGDHVPSSENFGGFMIDDKCAYAPTLLYLLHKAGRNVHEDAKVIRSHSQIPVACFQDRETGNRFFVNTLGFGPGHPSDAARLLEAAQTQIQPGNRINLNVFSSLEPLFKDVNEKLTKLVYPVPDDVAFIGWRREENRLVRVSHTGESGKTAYALTANGERTYVPAPRTLRFIHVGFIDSNIRLNPIDPKRTPADAADDAVKLITFSSDLRANQDQEAWWIQSLKFAFLHSIVLLRAIDPRSPTTIQQVYQLIMDDQALGVKLKLLKKFAPSRPPSPSTIPESARMARADAVADERRWVQHYSSWDAAITYFDNEWLLLHAETKKKLRSILTQTIPPLMDPILGSTSTIDFSEMFDRGRVFLYCGDGNEQSTKNVGLALKFAFHTAVLAEHKAHGFLRRPLLQATSSLRRWAILGHIFQGDVEFFHSIRTARIFTLAEGLSPGTSGSPSEIAASEELLNEFDYLLVFRSHADSSNRLYAKCVSENLRGSEPISPADFATLTTGEFKGICPTHPDLTQKQVQIRVKPSRLASAKFAEDVAIFIRGYLAQSIEQELWKQGASARLDPSPKKA